MRLAIFSKSDQLFFVFLQFTPQTERFEPNFLQTKSESSEDSNPFELAKNLKEVENPATRHIRPNKFIIA